MKKLLSLVLVLSHAITMFACGGQTSTAQATTETTVAQLV